MSDKKTAIQTERAPAAVGPYSQGMVANGLVFTAGQLGLVPETGKLIEGGIEEQTRQALANIAAVLEVGGASLADVVKVTVFLADINDFAAMNTVYDYAFSAVNAPYPARSAFEVANLPLGALVEIEAIAAL